jgi:RimJ/RimL family protein N-acetyltransferase
MDIRFERASEKYAAAFGAAVDAVARERKYLASTTGLPEDSTRTFVREIETNNWAQFYALQGERVVGWCDILPKRYEGFRHVGVLGMGVIASHRSIGIGKQLLSRTLDHAKNTNGLEKVELEVFRSNTIAIRMYEKMGFVSEGERVDARKLDGKYDNLVLMGKRL